VIPLPVPPIFIRRALTYFVLTVLASGPTFPADNPPPRVIARFDVALLALPNAGAKGGGGVLVPTGGTGAGLSDGFGVGLGAEVRLHRWIAFDAAAGQYWSELEVARYRGPDTMGDYCRGDAELRTLQLGLVLTPPKWRFEKARVAVGALVVRSEIPEVPSGLGISVDDSDTGIGVDFRAAYFFSSNRRWGIGAALAFVDIDPSFVDLETGASGSLQVSGFFLRIGVRGAW
jgi:hypothetical protein